MKLSQLEIQQTLTNSKDIQKGRIKVDAPKTEAGPDQRAASQAHLAHEAWALYKSNSISVVLG